MGRQQGVLAGLVALACLAATSCGIGSRYTGTWTGTVQQSGGGGVIGALMGAFAQATIGGPSTLTLHRGGKGFLKVGSAPEQPVTWSEEGEKLLIHPRPDQAQGAPSSSGQPASDTIVGTLSQDGHTLTLDLGPLKVVLTRAS